jgi:hypothetical protein
MVDEKGARANMYHRYGTSCAANALVHCKDTTTESAVSA